MARVLAAIASHRAQRLSCVEAGELVGLSVRHFRRLRDAYEERGGSGRCALEDEIAWTANVFKTRYYDFTIKYFHEQALGQAMADGKPFKRSTAGRRACCNYAG